MSIYNTIVQNGMCRMLKSELLYLDGWTDTEPKFYLFLLYDCLKIENDFGPLLAICNNLGFKKNFSVPFCFLL